MKELTRIDPIAFVYTGNEVVYYLTTPHSCIHHIQKDHILAYVYSGELCVHDGENEIVLKSQNSVFIRKNHRVKFLISQGNNDRIQIVFVVMRRSFLLDFYQQLDKSLLSNASAGFKDSFLKVTSSAGIESLFASLIPYINTAKQPLEKVMGLKLSEAVYSLLDARKNISNTLFDFVEPWKIDILDFLNNNFMYDLSIKEIALYTGRSMATFKRDFKKVSELSPQKWITKKRLEYAQQQLRKGKKVSDIYLDIGFSSLSHFSIAYKKAYGTAPTKNLTIV